MKLLRGWVIDLKNIRDLFNIRYFYIAGYRWILTTVLFYLLLLFWIGDSGFKFISLFILFLIYNAALFYIYIREKNKIIGVLKDTFNKIKNNSFAFSQEIYLPRYYIDIQDEVRSMYEKIQDDIDYLKKLEKVRTEFLGNVSHELRTPIFTIQGYLDTLLNGAIDDPKVNKHFLEKAMKHTDNLNTLLNDLIDISMMEAGQMRLSFRYFSAEKYFESIVNEFIPQAEQKSLKLILLSVAHNLQLFGDREKIKQVMTNLIQNAIKYTEDGTIEVIVEEEERGAKIIVRDSGIGIAPENLTRIFERFYMVDKARSKEAGGTGLGLAIVKHILDAHGTKIEVSSKLNEGTSFSFRLKK